VPILVKLDLPSESFDAVRERVRNDDAVEFALTCAECSNTVDSEGKRVVSAESSIISVVHRVRVDSKSDISVSKKACNADFGLESKVNAVDYPHYPSRNSSNGVAPIVRYGNTHSTSRRHGDDLCQLLGDSWRRLESLDGVIEANANFATDEGSVEYDPDEVSLAEIYETIEDAGYGAVSDTVTIGISDMTCANCRRTRPHSRTRQVSSRPRRTSPPTKRRSGTNPRTRHSTRSTTLSRTLVTRRSVKTATAVNRVKMLETLHDRVRFENSLRLTLFGAILSAPMLFFLAEKFLLGGEFSRRRSSASNSGGSNSCWRHPFRSCSAGRSTRTRTTRWSTTGAPTWTFSSHWVRPLRISTQSRYLPD